MVTSVQKWPAHTLEGRLHRLHQGRSPSLSCAKPKPHVLCLFLSVGCFTGRSQHPIIPLEARPHPSSSPVSPTSVPAWARDPGKPNPTQNASPLLRGTPKPPARVSAQPGPAERRTRFSSTHLTPTAGSVSLPVDRPA